MGNKIRQKIIFTGRVQGVGFRYRAKHAANRYGVTGWVRNEWDGTVQMEAQGSREEIDQMILALYENIYISIEKIQRQEMPLEDKERGFYIW